MVKSWFEQWLCEKSAMEVTHYHGDNGIFTVDEYRKDCGKKGKTHSFSGVGDQHQNERV